MKENVTLAPKLPQGPVIGGQRDVPGEFFEEKHCRFGGFPGFLRESALFI
ncbi:hypothetical protein [Nocardia miyunensis]|nr:hypothetical protein [Nocardia miyunensis]